MSPSEIRVAAFLPSAARAERLDREIRERLIDSLGAVAEALGEADVDVDDLRQGRDSLRNGPCPPQIFALHAGLVEAILGEDAPGAARWLAGFARSWERARSASVECVTLDDAMLGFDGAGQLYAGIAIDDPSTGIAIAPIDGDALQAASDRVRGALSLLGDAAPGLAAELAALVRQIVLVRAADNSARDFGGASSFHLWGALLLNAERYRSRVEIAEALTHEAAHLLLFGEAGGERIVHNDDSERHVSPLRDDPRPLDGIAHATFVLARMAWCVEALLDSGLLTPAERAEAEAALARNRRDYADGASVVLAHARLTPAGARMLDAAAAYMSRQMAA